MRSSGERESDESRRVEIAQDPQPVNCCLLVESGRGTEVCEESVFTSPPPRVIAALVGVPDIMPPETAAVCFEAESGMFTNVKLSFIPI